MSHRHCREFAAAGRGLPPVERGMPDPAGTGLSRRAFLLRAAGTMVAVYGGGNVAPQAFEEAIAHAQTQAPAPVLVNIYFAGGLDPIGVLGPYGSGRLRALRPTLHNPGTPLAFTGDSGFHWHPRAAILKELHEAGKLVVLPSVGYADANQSHFTSRHFWEVGATDVLARTGWMGRYVDQVGGPLNPLQGVTLGTSLVPSLAAGAMPVAAVDYPQSYRFEAPHVWQNQVEPPMLDALAAISATPSDGDPVLAQAKLAQANAYNLQRKLAGLGANTGSQTYDESVPFARRLKTLAHMLQANLGIRCAGLIANGDYDTHAGQENGFTAHLPHALQAIRTFQADLEQRGIADRVVTLIWSEFGRRPEENGSAGTDHGASAIGFVMGTKVRGSSAQRTGVVGAMPKIEARDLDEDGNIVHSIDFRDVYGSLLDQWLHADVDAILRGPGGGAADTTLPLIAA